MACCSCCGPIVGARRVRRQGRRRRVRQYRWRRRRRRTRRRAGPRRGHRQVGRQERRLVARGGATDLACCAVLHCAPKAPLALPRQRAAAAAGVAAGTAAGGRSRPRAAAGAAAGCVAGSHSASLSSSSSESLCSSSSFSSTSASSSTSCASWLESSPVVPLARAAAIRGDLARVGMACRVKRKPALSDGTARGPGECQAGPGVQCRGSAGRGHVQCGHWARLTRVPASTLPCASVAPRLRHRFVLNRGRGYAKLDRAVLYFNNANTFIAQSFRNTSL